MIDLAPSQRRYVYGLLRDARNGKSSYGGDTAEIYVYLLLPGHEPMWASKHPLPGGIIEAELHKCCFKAARNLYALLHEFRDCNIDIENASGWQRLGKWIYRDGRLESHRWHIRFERRVKPVRKQESTNEQPDSGT